MNRTLAAVGLTILVACTTAAPPSKTAPKAAVPATEAKPVVETLHGVTVTDPYRWLEDQEAPATRDWIARQNAYTDAMIGGLPQKQAAATRVEEMLNTDQVGTPAVRGGRYIFTKRPQGADPEGIYMRERAT